MLLLSKVLVNGKLIILCSLIKNDIALTYNTLFIGLSQLITPATDDASFNSAFRNMGSKRCFEETSTSPVIQAL